MMNLKGLKKIFILLLLASQIFSCDTTCVDADEFNIIPVTLDSNMRNMRVGVFGDYNHNDGGQRAEWFDTGIRTNGTKITLTITGGWIYTGGTTSSTQAEVDLIPLCNTCSKDISDSNPTQNCICNNYNGQVPSPIIQDNGLPTTCNSGLQAYPDFCTCFNRGNDYVYRYGVYHQSLNSLSKSSSEARIPLRGDKQTVCRMNRGMGAYIALWGVNGAQTPTRAYHLYTNQEYCPVPRGPNGECEKNGINVLRHVYQSPNNSIFVKDDGLQNNLPTTSTSTPGFQYHGPNEVVKLIVYDGFYDDNAGKYSIYFVGGFGGEKTSFILEFITGMFEDVLLGSRNSEGQRVGGVLEFFYNSVVNNPPFQMTVQFMLVLYIVFFGGSYLMGVIDITRKEVSMVIFKIALIILFTNPASWTFYKMFVVGTFKDGMDQLMAMIMMATDTATGDSSNLNFIAQGGRAIDGSNATRFSYPDMMMKKLLSSSVAKKLLGVIGDGNIYGIIYFFITYALIFYFIYVMLLVCSIYIVSFLKMILLLGLGPIFISLALFSKTNDMFKSWIAFLGSRALEMAVLFLVLSPFLMSIDKYFTDLLYYKVCGVQKGIPPLYLIILQTTGLDRSLFEWLLMFLKIATVIFIMQTILDRVPQMAGQLISIGGIPNQDTTSKIGYGASGFGLAMNAANAAIFGTLGAIKNTANFAVSKSGIVPGMISGATAIARKSGIASAWNAIGKKIPFRGPRTRMRDMVIEGAINEARAEGIKNGLKGKELDQHIRQSVMDNLSKRIAQDPTKMAMLGVDAKNIAKVMDRVLVRDGMKNFLKDRAQELKAEGLLGKEMRQRLREDAKEWAKDNLYDTGGVNKVDNYLKDRSIRSFLRSNAEYSSSEAAKIFTTPQDKAKYLEHLEDLKHRNQKKWENAKRNPVTHMVPYLLSRAKHEVIGDTKGNPNLARQNFDRKAHIEETGRPTWGRYLNPVSHINFLDRRLNKQQFEETRQLHDQLLQDRLGERLAKDDEGIGEVNPNDKKAVRRQKAKKIGQRDMMKDKLRELAIADIDRQLNQDADFNNPSGSFSLPGSFERKEQLQEKLLGDLFKDDGRTIFEKAVQYDHLVGKEFGKPSMEQLVAQASAKDADDLVKNLDKLSIDEIINRRESIDKGDAGKGLFAKKLDEKHYLSIADGLKGDFSPDNLFGPDVNSYSSPSQDPNKTSKEYENNLQAKLEQIDRKIVDKINEQVSAYEEEVDRLDDVVEQVEQNSRSSSKRGVSKKSYASKLRSVADQLETSLGSDITNSDQELISDLRQTADAVGRSDQLSSPSLPSYNLDAIDKKFAGRAELADGRLDQIRDQFKGLESERKQSQDVIDQNPIRPVSFPEMSPQSLRVEQENVAKSSYDVMSRSQDMLSEIGLWKNQNGINFDAKDLRNNQRNISVLNEGFDQARLNDSGYMLGQLDKNIGALRSMDSSLVAIPSSVQQGLGVDKAIKVNEQLRDSMIGLKGDIEKGTISPDQIKSKVIEISEGKKQVIDTYDKSITVFKVEDSLQRSIGEMAQFQQARVVDAPVLAPARAESAPRYIPQTSAIQSPDRVSGLAKFSENKYDDKVIQSNPSFAKALREDSAFLITVDSTLKEKISSNNGLGVDSSKDVELRTKIGELSGAIERGLAVIEKTPEGTIDLAKNQRIAEEVKDLKGQLQKQYSKDLETASNITLQQSIAKIDRYDPKVSQMISQERYSDPIVKDQEMFNKAMQRDLQDFQHIQKSLNLSNSPATIKQTQQLSEDLKSMTSMLQDKIAKTEDRQTSSEKLSPEDLSKISGEVKEQRQQFFEKNINQIADVTQRFATQSSVLDQSFVKPESLPIIPKASSQETSDSRPKSPPIPAPKRPDQAGQDISAPATPAKAQDGSTQSRPEARSDFINTQPNKLENAGEFRDSRDSSSVKATDVFKSPSYSSLTDSQGKIDVDKFSSNIQKDIASLSEISRQAIAVQDASALGNDANRKMANLQSIASDFQKNQNNPNLTPSQKEEISKNLAEVADQFKDSIVKNEGYRQQAGLNQFEFASLKQTASNTSDIFQSPSYSSLKDFQGNVDHDKFAKALEKDIGKILEINQLAKSTNDLSGLDKYSDSKARELLDVAISFDRVLRDSETPDQIRKLAINALAEDADRIKKEFVENKTVKEQAGLNEIIYSNIKSADSSAPSQALPRFTASPQEVRGSSQDQQSQPKLDDRNPLTYLPPIKGVPSSSDSRPKSPPIPAPKRPDQAGQDISAPATPAKAQDGSTQTRPEARSDFINTQQNKLENAGEFRDSRDSSSVKATDVFQSPSYSSLSDSQGKIDVDKFSSNLQKDIASLEKIQDRSQQLGDVGIATQSTDLKDKLAGVASQVKEVAGDDRLAKEQKQVIYAELSQSVDDFKKPFVENQQIKDSVSSDRYLVDKLSPSRDSASLDQSRTLDQASLPPAKPLPQIPTKPAVKDDSQDQLRASLPPAKPLPQIPTKPAVKDDSQDQLRASLPPAKPLPQIPTKPAVKDDKDSTLESPKDPKIQDPTTPRIDPYNAEKNKSETINPPSLPLSNPREQEQPQQDQRELKVPQNPQELKELLQRNVDGLQMLQSRLNAIKSKTLSDIELRTKITKISDNLQTKIEAVDKIPDQGNFKAEQISPQQIQEFTKSVDKEKAEILRDYDSSIRKVGENLGRQMVADSALSTKLSYSKGDIFKDIDVSANPLQKELGADISNVDRQIKAIDKIDRAHSSIQNIADRIIAVPLDSSESMRGANEQRDNLLQQKQQIDKLYLTAAKQIQSGDSLSAIDKTFENISEAQSKFKEDGKLFSQELKNLNIVEKPNSLLETLDQRLDSLPSKAFKENSADMLYQDRQELFDRNKEQIRDKLVKENNQTEELFLSSKEASEISQDKSLKKVVDQLGELRKSEEKLLQDFDDFGKSKDLAKSDLSKSDKEKDKELNSLFDSSISKKYDEIKERRQNLIKTMKAFDQSDSGDLKHKAIMDQSTEMRINPYKGNEFYQKTMPATSELGNMLADPKVRDDLEAVGLRVGRYERDLSNPQLKDLDEKADAIKQNLSKPSLLSELAKESEFDRQSLSSPSLKDLSVAKIDSLKEESKFLKSQVNELSTSPLLSSQEGFGQQVKDLVSEQQKLESLYTKAQGQIDKGSALQDIDLTMKEIKKTQDSFVLESRLFTDQSLSFVNSKINDPRSSSETRDELMNLNKDLTKLDQQTTSFDKGKITESTMDFVAPNRFEKFEQNRESIIQGVIQDNARIDDFQKSLKEVPQGSANPKIGSFGQEAQDISESQKQAIKSMQELDKSQVLNDDKKNKIDELVFRLEDLNNRQRKLVDEYVKANSSNPELLESIDRAKKTYEFFDAEQRAQEAAKLAKSDSTSVVQDKTTMFMAEARLEQVSGISKALISSQISDALIAGKFSDALLSGKFQDVLLKGGLPMIGGSMAGSAPEFESQNSAKLQTEKKINQLSLKMDKLNMKMVEHQISQMQNQKGSGEDKFLLMAKKAQLSELKTSLDARKRKIKDLDEKLGNKD